MSANIEALVVKHCNDLFNPDVTGAQVIRNALTEQAEAFKGELQAYDGTVRELTKTVEDMRAAQSVPVGWDTLGIEKLESLGWQISVCQMCGTHASAIKPTSELATLREKAAEADELRKDAERLPVLEHTLRHLGRELAKLDKYRLCMSYNDSYFGEPVGTVKRVVVELRHCIDAAIAGEK